MKKNSRAYRQLAGARAEIYAKLRLIRDQYAGEIRDRFPQIPRRVSGYNLDELLPERGFDVARALVGTEGTCAIVLEAKLKLIHSPQHRTLVGIGYEDAFIAADHVPEILEFRPIGLEGFEGSIVDSLKQKGAPHVDLLPEGRGILLVEFGGDDPSQPEVVAQKLLARLKSTSIPPTTRLYTKEDARHVWHLREAGPRAAAFAPGAVPEWEGWDDAAVAPEKLGGYLRDIRKLMDEYGYRGSFYGHFGHGCIHMRVSFDLQSEAGIRKYGGVHRSRCRPGNQLRWFAFRGTWRWTVARGFAAKNVWSGVDARFCGIQGNLGSGNKMNPHKVVDAYLPTENLRLGADYKPLQPATHFAFSGDDGSLAQATLRCIGLGACRKQDGGAMCPSYMVTLEEEHSTRGRAHLLFEMLQGEVVRDGWQDEHVKKSLDLCLSCKACKSECPANVDLATYRAEFLSHYYEKKSRPWHAYLFGRIDQWARLVSPFAGFVNFLGRASWARAVVNSVVGLAPQRELPQFATSNFQSWLRSRTVSASTEDSNADRSKVFLWSDTFNNYFHPETCRAALEVLEDAGFQVTTSTQHLCCGRPLYDFGMLDKAKGYLLRIMQLLGPQIAKGTPIIVLEPSCASVFRDELVNLFPGNATAKKLRSQTFLLSEFLQHHAGGYEPPPLKRKIVLQGHCHHQSLMKMTDEVALLRRMGADVNLLDSGCCGMAGAFGFERDKFEISQAIGERVLLPAIRQQSNETLIVADGFSCREQIRQGTGRDALHLSEVLSLALKQRVPAAKREDR